MTGQSRAIATRARKPTVRDAEAEAARDQWKCRTCTAPAAEDDEFCWFCRSYWDGGYDGRSERG